MMETAKIFEQRPDIKKKVYETYPVSKKEKRCVSKKNEMNGKREHLAKRLYDQPNK